ncbi:MAG: acyltransferase [Bacteroidales bacterium]|nr:acyltransferase [Bacteroidales bacterium]
MSFVIHHLKLKRKIQVLRYAWNDSKVVATRNEVSRIAVYKDMLKCYRLYNCWSNYYREADLWNKSSEEKVAMAKQQGELFAKRDEYVQYKYAERAFLSKYSSMRYEKSPRLTHKRAEAYRERYHIPQSVIMQYGLILMTEHYTIGKLIVGENCLLGRNVDIDYTGGLELRDSVSLMDGVKILTHAHDSFNINSDNDYLPFSNYAFATPLKIGKNTSIGSRSIILPGVGEIGENVMVSAGSVVKEKVPSNCIVAGNPAKVVAKIPKGLKRVYETGFGGMTKQEWNHLPNEEKRQVKTDRLMKKAGMDVEKEG